ncbi:DNA-directed RNA polymerase I core subunit rpa12 [Coelomomyces lativittatus]|nr:DNA-directed RNA polymerase I core subunit rpa12 [Coelomomyces lativittatus]
MDHRDIYLWKTKQQTWDTKPQAATINEKCPKCLNPQMNFHTLQLRSVDEGQTVFYSCEKCGHTFSLNN